MSDSEAPDAGAERLDASANVPASMVTQLWPIGRVQRYTNNPRKRGNVLKIVESLKAYGWRFPIIVDRDGVIIAGDGRYLAALELALATVPVWVAADLTPAQVHAFRIADNRIHEESDWDAGALRQELELLAKLGYEDVDALLAATAFDRDEIDRLLSLDSDPAHALEAIDTKPFPPTTWVLIGIPTVRFIEIADLVDRITAVPDVVLELSANDDTLEKNRPS